MCVVTYVVTLNIKLDGQNANSIQRIRRRKSSSGSASLFPAIPGRAGTGGRTPEKKGRDRPRADEQTPFRGWKTRTRGENDRRHRFGAAGRRVTAQTDERHGPKGEEHHE